MKKISLVVLFSALIAVMIYIAEKQTIDVVEKTEVKEARDYRASVISHNEDSGINGPSTRNNKSNSNDRDAILFQILGQQVKTKIQGRMSNPYWQIKMLTDLRQIFKKQFPDTWKEKLVEFLASTFPNFSNILIEKLHGLLAYETWIASLKNEASFSSIKQRQMVLWDKRLEIFGEEAYVIWEAALKTEEFEGKMHALEATIGTFEEKQDQYIQSIRDTFGHQSIGENAPHKTQMLSKFLSLDNVQSDLHSMQEEERHEAMRNFRQAMGLDEKALQRWEKLDNERALARSVGETYIQEKAKLETLHQGKALEENISSLRIDLFGEPEATYIHNEEVSGYYRFEAPQQYGIN